MSENQKDDSQVSARPRGMRFLISATVAGVLVIALILGAIMVFSGGSDGPESDAAPKNQGASAPQADLSKLIESNTHSKLDAAPRDPAPMDATDGTVVHPTKAVSIHAAPNGKPIAKIGEKQLGDTWLPVIAKQDGWVQVLLPSKPNSSTGWLRSAGLKKAFTPYVIKVHLTSMKMELIFEGRQEGSWTIGTGKPDTPTPTGRTFLLGSIVDPKQEYSPVILPLGAHSDTLDSFGGGPGTVAIHTWPTTDVLGTATSHGCIRVPQDALNRLRQVPLGTLVLVDQK